MGEKGETTKERLARIEAGVDYLKQEFSAFTGKVEAMMEALQDHRVQIALLKQKRRWKSLLHGGGGVAIGSALAAIVEYFKSKGH